MSTFTEKFPQKALPFQQFVVIADRAHLRKEPSLNGKIDGHLNLGDAVECFKVSGDDYWYKVKRSDGISGWIAHKYLACSDNDNDIIEGEKYPWMPIAIREIGCRKYVGAYDNPRVLNYLGSTTLGKTQHHQDAIFWASAFVNWCIERAGCIGTDSAWARTWQYWGVTTDTPERGCVVLFRSNGIAHVGFYSRSISEQIEVLGGHKIDEVGYKLFDPADVIAYRLPIV